MKGIRYSSFLAIMTLHVMSVEAQDTLVNLSSYPISNLSSKIQASSAISKSKSSVQLPFFDDFSRRGVFPTDELWEVTGVTANQLYAVNPPTVGVATFDAVDFTGMLYSYLTTLPTAADTITSLPINLNYLPSDSIYLSFYIQPKGLGYSPSRGDSLVVEFYSPMEGAWVRAWSASVNFADSTLAFRNHLERSSTTTHSNALDRNFFRVMMGITQPEFLSDGFRFRFMNYASISPSQEVQGLKSNCDHWHLDMVYLDKYRNLNDTVINDVAFFKPVKNLLRTYSSVPWKHFTRAFSEEFPSPLEFSVGYRNLGDEVWNVTRRYEIVDESGAQPDYLFMGGAENIHEFQDVSYTRFFSYNFQSAWSDSAKFLLKAYLITENKSPLSLPYYLNFNDTISYNLNFYNYYALDDGTAESGYGLYGEGAENGMVAVRFQNYQADSLSGVMIYFNRTYNNANDIGFKITLWDERNGMPGNIIYQKSGVRPLFTDSLDRFTVYALDKVELKEGSFYIGWQQESSGMLNVGFDMNSNNSSRTLYNLNGEWVETRYNGSVMIRPIFGKLYQIPTNVDIQQPSLGFSIFPNPAQHHIRLSLPDGFTPKAIQLINTAGHVVASRPYETNELFYLEGIAPGFYMVRVSNDMGRCLTGKVIVVK